MKANADKGDSSERTDEGIIVEVLPKQMFQVRLQDGRMVRVGIDGKARHAIVRLIQGDRVSVRVSGVDPTRGQVVRKL